MCTIVCTVAARHPRLGRPPLRVALCQLRFPEHFGFSPSDAAAIHEVVRGTYPRADHQFQQIFQISLDNVQQVQAPQPIYRFMSNDGAWAVSLTSSFVTLETTNYQRFGDFETRWTALVEAVVERIGVDQQERLGLRYVNELRLPAESASLKEGLQRVLSPAFLGPIGMGELIEEPTAAMTEIRFQHVAGMATLRHGLQIPEPTGPASYVIDVDVYDDSVRALDIPEEGRAMRGFNEVAFALLESSVTREQFAAFEPVEEDADDSTT